MGKGRDPRFDSLSKRNEKVEGGHDPGGVRHKGRGSILWAMEGLAPRMDTSWERKAREDVLQAKERCSMPPCIAKVRREHAEGNDPSFFHSGNRTPGFEEPS